MEYKGYGDLADEYTFTMPTQKVDITQKVSTSTDEKSTDIIPDTVTDPIAG